MKFALAALALGLLAACESGDGGPDPAPVEPVEPVETPSATGAGAQEAGPDERPISTHRSNRVGAPDWAAMTADPDYCSSNSCEGRARFFNETGEQAFFLVFNRTEEVPAGAIVRHEFELDPNAERYIDIRQGDEYCAGTMAAPQLGDCLPEGRSNWIIVLKP